MLHRNYKKYRLLKKVEDYLDYLKNYGYESFKKDHAYRLTYNREISLYHNSFRPKISFYIFHCDSKVVIDFCFEFEKTIKILYAIITLLLWGIAILLLFLSSLKLVASVFVFIPLGMLCFQSILAKTLFQINIKRFLSFSAEWIAEFN